MARLGTATNSKKEWAKPMPTDSLGPGSVLMAEPGSFDHYFLESLVLIIEHSQEGTRGVLLNHETPWQVEDMAPGSLPVFSANKLFLGGDTGRDTMIMIHGEHELPGATEVGCGVYQGGVANAVRAVEKGALPPSRFKFFYKTVEWMPGALQAELDSGQYRLVELSPAWLFGQSGQRRMWGEVRYAAGIRDDDGADAAGAAGAMAPGEQGGLAYERRAKSAAADTAETLDTAASKAVKGLKETAKGKGVEDHRRAREAEDERIGKLVSEISSGTVQVKQDSTAEAEAKAAFEARLARAAEEEQARASGQGLPAKTAPAAGGTGTGASQLEAKAWLAERGIQAPPNKEDAPPEGSAPSATEVSAAGIEEVLAFRRFKGNEQWRVRWQGEDEEGDTWEAWRVLDTAALRSRADQLRDEAM